MKTKKEKEKQKKSKESTRVRGSAEGRVRWAGCVIVLLGMSMLLSKNLSAERKEAAEEA